VKTCGGELPTKKTPEQVSKLFTFFFAEDVFIFSFDRICGSSKVADVGGW
jgi:hypothetical protein